MCLHLLTVQAVKEAVQSNWSAGVREEIEGR